MEPTYRIAQRLHERRAAVGLPKYGQHLTADSQGCMLVHALEEAADQVNYLLAEIQRRREALLKIYAVIANLQRWHNSNLNREAEALMAVAESFGGESALAQYDEILGGGTVAQNATVDPLSDPAISTLHKFATTELPQIETITTSGSLPTDHRDEALRVAMEALLSVADSIAAQEHFDRYPSDHNYQCVCELNIKSATLRRAALAAIRAAGGAR